MSFIDAILNNLPEVKNPTEQKLSFNEKLKWTSIILVLYFILGSIPLAKLGKNGLQTFQFLSVILGASFGSIISLGIGPIVTASIVLQLLNGSGIFSFDLKTSEGKRRFQGIQKLLSIFFILFEAAIYVFMGGLSPVEGVSPWIIIIQLMIGGILILFFDEVVSKWGFGSGISLFIAAGVSKTIFIRAFSWLPGQGVEGYSYATGAIFQLFQSLAQADSVTFSLALSSILATLIVFIMSVYVESMRVEIPLSYGAVRGYGMRWPLKFIYTSNIPVILAAALTANFQLWARLFQNWGFPILGKFAEGSNVPISGIVKWISIPGRTQHGLVGELVSGTVTGTQILQSFSYLIYFMIACVIFSWFWMQTSGMDSSSQAQNILDSGLQIPGFRKDQRILERLLDRYIPALTVMGAIAVGLLAAIADLAGALANGTGILLTVMIVYQLYEEIAKEHMMDMNPMLRKFIKV